MSAPSSPSEVALALAKLGRALDEAVRRLDEADRAAVEAREVFTLNYARAFLTAEGPMDVRKYIATERTHEERLAAEVADQMVRNLRNQITALRNRIDIGRSLGTAMRAEISLTNGGIEP